MASIITRNNQALLERRNRDEIQSLRDDVEGHAHNTLRFKEKQQQFSLAIDGLDRDNPDFVGLGMHRITAYFFFVFVLLAIYCIDYFMFHAVSSDLIKRFLSPPQWVINLGCFLIPAAIIAIELYVATQRSLAYDERVQLGLSIRYWVWSVIGIILSFVMTSLVVSTFLASQPSLITQKLETILTWKLVGLAALAFVSHAGVIFGGSYAHEAKSYFVFKSHHLFLRFRVRQCERRFEREALATSRTMSRYLNLLNQYNETYNPRISGGPFDSATTAFVNEIFGYSVIQAQNEPQPSKGDRSLDQPPTEPPQDVVLKNLSRDGGDGNGTPAFYDSIVRQVKDGDSEVRN
jgi:hypothetical protein